MRRLAPAAPFLFLAAMIFISAGPAPAQEWPRFRGPNGGGVSEAASIPARWTEKDYHWKVALPGGGHSSPVLWGDRIFVTCADKETARRIILCLKTADGAVLWKREYESTPCHLNNSNSYATTTPAADKDRVVVSWATPEHYTVVALDHDGKEMWRRDLGPFASQHGHGASPMIFEDLVIVPNDQDGKSFIAALDSGTGQFRWQADRKSGRAAYSTPCVFQREGGRPELICTSTAGGMTSLDPATGKMNWEVPDVFPSPKRVVGSPTVACGLVLAACGEGSAGMHVAAVRPPAAGGAKPEVAWEVTKSSPYVPTPVARGDLVFLWNDTGTVACVRGSTGQEVWREKVGGNFFGSPVRVGDRLYCISTKGEVVVLAAGEKYELLARNPLGEMSHATPAVAGGRMYLRTWSHLISIGGKS